MEEKFNPLKETKTLIIDKETDQLSDSVFSGEKKEVAKKILFENNSPEKLVAEQMRRNTEARTLAESKSQNSKIEFEAVKSFVSENPEQIVKTESLFLKEPEIQTKQSIDELKWVKKEVEEKVEEEILQEEKKEIKEKTEDVKKFKPKIGLKKRLKIITFGFFAILTCFLGWSIYNAIEIETLRAQIEASNKTYGINLVNYITYIAKADDLQTDSLLNLEQLSQAGIISIAPEALENPVEYTIRSNWFDRLCNWLSGGIK